MAFQITDRKLEDRLEKHASRMQLRPAKSRLAAAILHAAMEAADAGSCTVEKVIRDLEDRAKPQSQSRLRRDN